MKKAGMGGKHMTSGTKPKGNVNLGAHTSKRPKLIGLKSMGTKAPMAKLHKKSPKK